MPKYMKGKSITAGLPPGALIHIGEKKTERVRIRVINYDENQLLEKEIKKVEECLPFKEKPTVTWINIEGIHQVNVLKKISDCFSLHPLVMEDILDTEERPKMEYYEDYIFIVLKMVYTEEEDSKVGYEQVSLVLGPNFVLSFQEKEGDVFEPVRERIRNKGRIRKQGADYLTYSLVDAIVDGYFIVLEKLGERIEFVEEKLLTNPTSQNLQEIHELKREIMLLRKSVWPLREIISGLERGESPLIQKSTAVYLRDVYDHVIQIIDTIETLREMLTGMLDIYLSSISNKMNEVMKVLTVIATIFIPLTFVAGVYGMNFEYMPELKWRWGYPLVLLVMLAVGISMLIFFRKRKWL